MKLRAKDIIQLCTGCVVGLHVVTGNFNFICKIPLMLRYYDNIHSVKTLYRLVERL